MQAATGSWRVFGSLGCCHASGLPGARTERVQHIFSLHHQDAPRENQYVNLISFFKNRNSFPQLQLSRFLSVLGLPSQVEELCPDIPELEVLMKEIHDLAESGARYTEMPHVIEITLPMLCNYLPRWWERGPENFPEQEGQLCTSVTSEHLNQLLGSIMKIVVNNLGIDEASWMKRLAGQ